MGHSRVPVGRYPVIAPSEGAQGMSTTKAIRRGVPVAIALVAILNSGWQNSNFTLPFCATPNESSASGLASLQEFVVASDTGAVAERARLGVTGISPSSVSVISDESTCQRASAELDTLLGDPQTNRAVYVYTFGSRFVVDDPENAGHFRPVFVFDSSWANVPTKLAF
jgi:hypothetical protein